MAIIGYDAEQEEVPNDQKIKNCFTLSILMLVGMPLIGVLLYYLKKSIIDGGYVSEIGAQQIWGAYVIIAVFLTIAITFTLFYLRRKLRKEAMEKETIKEESDNE